LSNSHFSPEIAKKLTYLLSSCAGSLGMVGGQVLDLQGEGKAPDLEKTKEIHEKKTAAIISGCLEAGALIAGAKEEKAKTMAQAGKLFGLAFQIKDDILDITSTSEKLGKTPGKDEKVNKRTWPQCVGIEKSFDQASSYIKEGKDLLADIGIKEGYLIEIADFILTREK